MKYFQSQAENDCANIMSQHKVRFTRVPAPLLRNLGSVIFDMLPAQGEIKIQQDMPNKVHDWHVHDTHETLVVLQGRIKFCSQTGERLCRPGDMIHLPKNTLHRSIASDVGAVYLISMEALPSE